MILGQTVHAALDRFFGLKPEFRDRARLHRCLRNVWRRHVPPGTFQTREEEAEAGKAGLVLLSQFLDSFDTQLTPLSREQWVSVRLENGIEIFTRADRVDGDASGDWIDIVDYKTGARRLESEDLAREPAAQAMAVAASAVYRRPVRRVRFLFLASGEEARWEVEEEDLELARQRLLKATDEILADRDFEPLPGDQCRYCAWAHLCPSAGRVELADLEVPEDLDF